MTIHEAGEVRSIDVDLVPRDRYLTAGRLILRVESGQTSPQTLLDFAKHRRKSMTGPIEMFARMREGDLEAWNKVWGSHSGWARLHMTPRDDGSIEVQQALYPRVDTHMPAGTYDVYVVERATGRAAYAPAVRVLGDQENRYDVRLEPGTLVALADVMPAGQVFTKIEVRTPEGGRMPILDLRFDGYATFDTPHTLEYLLRIPRRPVKLGPYPASSVEVLTVDAEGRSNTLTVKGAGVVAR